MLARRVGRFNRRGIGGTPASAAVFVSDAVVSSAATDTVGTTVTFTLNRALAANASVDPSQVTITDTSLHADHRTQNPTLVSVSGNDITCTLATPCFTGGTITGSYTRGAEPILDEDGGYVANFTGQAISNVSNQPAPILFVYMRKTSCFTQSGGEVISLINAVNNESFATVTNDEPDYNATGLNSLPAAINTNTPQTGLIGTIPAAVATACLDATPTFTFVIAWDPNNTDFIANFLLVGNSADTDRVSLGSTNTGTGRYRAFIDNGTASTTNDATVDMANTPQVVSMHRHDDSTLSVKVNGTAVTGLDGVANARIPAALDQIAFATGLSVNAGSGAFGLWAIYATDVSGDAQTALHAWLQSASGYSISA